MAKSHNQKAKILFLVKMLLGTGENQVVTMQEILSQLAEYGISAERKSIYDDFEALREFGMDVRFKRGRPGGYYLADQGPFAGWKERGGAAEKAADGGGRGTLFDMAPNLPGDPGGISETSSQKAEYRSAGRKEESAAESSVKSGETESREWKFTRESAALEEKKQMRLLCSVRREKEIREYFGDEGEYKERGYGNFTLAVPLRNSPSFYGWLASMERDVYIVKPRKAALAYREYLKKIAREYKGI